MIYNIIKKFILFFKKSLNSFTKLNNIQKLFIIFLILVFCFVILTNFKELDISLENFDNNNLLFKKNYFEIKKNEDIYDDFYSNYYDNISNNEHRKNFEIGLISKIGNNNINTNILDVGCGTGDHVNKMYNKDYGVIGLDKSSSMINKAKEKYPECDFKVGDILNNNIFEYDSFTHIVCLGRTIYLIKDKAKFFENCYSLLEDGGHLVINLTKRDDFNIFISNNKNNTLYNSEKYGKKNTQHIVKFNKDIEYVCNYKNNEDLNDENLEPYYQVIEKFQNFNTHSVRKNICELYMPKISTIVNIAKSKGLNLVDKLSYKDSGYRNEYLYVFKK
tara:strand:- start:2035 stop:3030 length:996 start_codon:yes stop_codon:yes gene_type:complete